MTNFKISFIEKSVIYAIVQIYTFKMTLEITMSLISRSIP